MNNSYSGSRRILTDLQICQKPTGQRGIGRYTSALFAAMCSQAEMREIMALVTAEPSPTKYHPPLPDRRIIKMPNAFRWKTPPFRHGGADEPLASAAYSSFIAPFRCDVVHISSLFSTGQNLCPVPDLRFKSPAQVYSATLYDLIPLRVADITPHYSKPDFADWYALRLSWLKRADLLLSISEASRRDAIELLSIDPDRIVNISGGIPEGLDTEPVAPEAIKATLARHGLARPFALYIGGDTERKNTGGAIRGFAELPNNVRNGHQLAIVCALSPGSIETNARLAQSLGLKRDEVVFTNFVTDEELKHLYLSCAVMFFPSLYEGFGLPALEAMSYGAPTIVADNSSLPEIVDRRDARFDAANPGDIARALNSVLTDKNFAADLKAYGLKRAKQFSFARSAHLALEAFDEALARARHTGVTCAVGGWLPQKKLACLSPLPPGESRAARYAAALLPHLARHFDIDVYTPNVAVDPLNLTTVFNIFHVDDFKARAAGYDMILYEFADAAPHGYFLDLMRQFPGVVSMHDIFGGQALKQAMALSGDDHFVEKEMLYAHGPRFRSRLFAAKVEDGAEKAASVALPGAKRILDDSIGLIFHSEQALEDCHGHYPEGFNAPYRLLGQVEENHTDADFAACAAKHAAILYEFYELAKSALPENQVKFFAPHLAYCEDARQAQSTAIDWLVNSPRPTRNRPKLFFFVGQTVHRDWQTGINRATTNLAKALYLSERPGFEPVAFDLINGRMVVPIKWLVAQGCLSPLERTTDIEPECPDFSPGDIVLLMDYFLAHYKSFDAYLQKARNAGCEIISVLDDLIPLHLPQYFDSDARTQFSKYIAYMSSFSDRVIGISKTTADSYIEWCRENLPTEVARPHVGFWHLGFANWDVRLGQTAPSSRLAGLQNKRFLLMVGSLEPRKNHELAIAATRRLLLANPDLCLCIVGAHSWKSDDLLKRLQAAEEDGIAFIHKASDQELAWLYAHAKALLFVSQNEGFGLPLVEAAQFGTPVICSDIPVFHELCGDFATYARIDNAENLAEDIARWIESDKRGLTPDAANIPHLTWEESADQLLDLLFSEL
jgi:glycosyltransferase involved in cell wall biosynthesis